IEGFGKSPVATRDGTVLGNSTTCITDDRILVFVIIAVTCVHICFKGCGKAVGQHEIKITYPVECIAYCPTIIQFRLPYHVAVTVLIAGYDLLRVSVLVVDDIASAVPLRVSGTVKHIIPLIHLYGGSGI